MQLKITPSCKSCNSLQVLSFCAAKLKFTDSFFGSVVGSSGGFFQHICGELYFFRFMKRGFESTGFQKGEGPKQHFHGSWIDQGCRSKVLQILGFVSQQEP